MCDGRKPVVHIVDDDEAVRTSLTMLAQARGWQVSAFESARKYLDCDCRSPNCPSVLVIDLHMPGMNGAELHEALRARGRNIPTIVLTAWPQGDLAGRIQAEGAQAVLAKPFDPGEWVRQVERLIPASGCSGARPDG